MQTRINYKLFKKIIDEFNQILGDTKFEYFEPIDFVKDNEGNKKFFASLDMGMGHYIYIGIIEFPSCFTCKRSEKTSCFFFYHVDYSWSSQFTSFEHYKNLTFNTLVNDNRLADLKTTLHGAYYIKNTLNWNLLKY